VGEEVKKSLFHAIAGFPGLAWLLLCNFKLLMLTSLQSPRYYTLGERGKAEASAEVFNLLHRPNVNGINTVRGAPDFLGPIPQKFGDHVSSSANPTFGTPNFVALARQIQLVMRLNF
jgi:hypothetical protein